MPRTWPHDSFPPGEDLGGGHALEHPRSLQQHASIRIDKPVFEGQQQLQGQALDDLHHPGPLHLAGQAHRLCRGLLHALQRI